MASPSRIQVLKNDVIDRIAAGEVVERPGSVVKELLENSIDAGATIIQVDIEGGGLSRISVSDDGCGIAGADASRALLRHATSKLSRAEDLFAIETLGFRGEALSSIASVSKLTLTTRRADEDAGTRVVCVGGEVVETGEVGCPVGTTVDVRELFFNTPARRRFMRSPATEQAHIVDAATRVMLGARRGGLILQSGPRRLLDLPESTDEQSRVKAVLPRKVDALFPFDDSRDGVRVSGFVTRPEVDRGDTRGMWFFVNGRFIRDRMLQRALLDGYRSMLERGRYPIVVVYVDIDSTAVDVNVHPQKLEVRFSDSSAVFRAVSRAITKVLAQTPWVSAGKGVPGAVDPAVLHLARDAAAASYAPSFDGIASLQSSMQLPLDAGGYFSKLEPLGQALGVYLVCQGDSELVLIDQHAAHERVAFEKLRLQSANGQIERQPLLFPEALDADATLSELVEKRASDLLAFGFEVEPVGPGRIAIRAIPAALGAAPALALFRDLIDELRNDEEGFGVVAEDATARILSRCACHTAVRAGDALGREEIRALLVELDRVDFGANCPHGRPVYHRLPRAELDKIFHRG